MKHEFLCKAFYQIQLNGSIFMQMHDTNILLPIYMQLLQLQCDTNISWILSKRETLIFFVKTKPDVNVLVTSALWRFSLILLILLPRLSMFDWIFHIILQISNLLNYWKRLENFVTPHFNYPTNLKDELTVCFTD